MSYLNAPRLHFSGRFQADPSTVNNNDSNYDPTVKLSNEPPDPSNPISNTSVYWNPNGTHNWKLKDCIVRGAANSQGPFSDPTADPIIGARVLSVGTYPAKIVDLDPDNQCVSQIYGLQIQVAIPNPSDPSQVLASLTGTMPPTAFCDLWNRATNAAQPSNGTMSAAYQAVLQNIVWNNPSASPLLAALAQQSPNALSLRFLIDSFQSDANQSNFTYGRLVGTIGPWSAGEAPSSTPRRIAPCNFSSSTPSIMSAYGPANATVDAARSVLIVDLGNCVPTVSTPQPPSSPSIPVAGWPVENGSFSLTVPGPSVNPNARYTGIKSGSGLQAGAPTVVGTIAFSSATYTNFAGIVELPMTPDVASLVARQPLKLTDVTQPAAPAIAAQEDLQGRYVDVDVAFMRLNPNESGQVTLWATLFGQPWVGAELDVALVPAAQASNGPTSAPYLWLNGSPPSALSLSSSSLITGSGGTAVLTLSASDPGTPRTYPDGEPGPDGQVYLVTGEWASWGQIYLFPTAPINVLVFSSYPMPAAPTWSADVGPILSNYARMYPYMKTIVDLSDYNTVVANANAIKHVLNLSPSDPHHMPIVRDLSRDKLAMINQWFESGMPQ